jgi:hypothetical protein
VLTGIHRYAASAVYRRSPCVPIRLLNVERLEERNLLAAIQMTPQEQLLIELLNRARANPTEEAARFGIDLNQDVEEDQKISSDPKQPLSPHQSLINAARGHSENMLTRDEFDHVVDGKSPADRARAAGYPVGAGENIAWSGCKEDFDRDAEVYVQHEHLFLSPPHRTNLMSPGYREVGNGIKYGYYESCFGIMVTENFGSRGGDAFITGVAYTDSIKPDRFYDIGEGIEGVLVTAIRRSDGATYSTTTGPSGGYGLQVPPGIYEVKGDGRRLNGVTVSNVVINGLNQKVDFNTRDSGLGSIEGRIFADADQNGLAGPNEAPVAAQTVYIDDLDNSRLDVPETRVISDRNGVFRFDGLRQGKYRVRIEVPAGRTLTAPSGGLFEIDLQVGQKMSELSFGLTPPNSPPTTVPDAAETLASVSVVIDAIKNDYDDDGRIMVRSVQIVQRPSYGTARVDTITGEIVYIPNAGFVGKDSFLYAVSDDDGLRSAPARVDVQVQSGVGNVWQNPRERFDVSNDGVVSPRDALQVVNDINRGGARALQMPSAAKSPPPYVDVSGDGFVSASDALRVINELERRLAAATDSDGEGEPVSAIAATTPPYRPVAGDRVRTVGAGSERFRRDKIDEFFALAMWPSLENDRTIRSKRLPCDPIANICAFGALSND